MNKRKKQEDALINQLHVLQEAIDLLREVSRKSSLKRLVNISGLTGCIFSYPATFQNTSATFQEKLRQLNKIARVRHVLPNQTADEDVLSVPGCAAKYLDFSLGYLLNRFESKRVEVESLVAPIVDRRRVYTFLMGDRGYGKAESAVGQSFFKHPTLFERQVMRIVLSYAKTATKNKR